MLVQEKLRAVFKRPAYVRYNPTSTFGQSTVANNPYAMYRHGGLIGAINTAKSSSKWGSILNRTERFLDYEMMDSHPLVSNALDVISDDVVTQDYSNDVLKIKCDNQDIVKELEVLFHDVLDIEYQLWYWTRNMLKYGDCYIFLQIDKESGVLDGISIPPNFVERREELTPSGMVVTFSVQGATRVFTEQEMLDFRLIGDEKFFPYGKAVLEPARRTWKLLRMMEDSMMIYRVIRAPERRIFYVEVGNMEPAAVESYINEVRNSTESMPVIDPETGEVDIRYGPTSIAENYYIPTRGGVELNKIDTLKGGENQNAVEDIKFILNELLSALKVPKSFLGYEETITRNNLSSEETRYARTVQRIQKMIVNELYKVAYIHLTALGGYEDKDLMGFEIDLFNPSQIYELQKLEVLRSKADTAEKLMAYFSEEYIFKEIFGLTDDEIKIERIRRMNELKMQSFIEMVKGIRAVDFAEAIKTLQGIDFDYDKFFKPEQEKKIEKIEGETDINKFRSKIKRKNPEEYTPKFGSLFKTTKDMMDQSGLNSLHDKLEENEEESVEKEIDKHLNEISLRDSSNRSYFISKIKKLVLDNIETDKEITEE